MFLAVLCLLGAGCGHIRSSRDRMDTDEVLATPENARLRAGLSLDVTLMVAGEREFQEKNKRVSDAGTITLPLLGSVEVVGYRLGELDAKLSRRYEKYFVNPQVITDFSAEAGQDGIYPWGHVTVLGRVRNPGRIGIPPTRDLTVSGAVQRAGGLDSSARSNAIRITRRINGETEQRRINLNAVGADGRLDEDMPLLPEDVIYVPEARF